MPIENAINVEAVIKFFNGNGLCVAELSNGHQVIAHASSRDRVESAALRVGDSVRLEMSPFDMTKGRILFEKHDNKFKNESSRIS